MSKQVWCIMRTNSVGNVQVDSIYTSEEHAQKEACTEKYAKEHVWVDGPYELRD